MLNTNSFAVAVLTLISFCDTIHAEEPVNFEQRETLSMEPGVRKICVADLNADGASDLAVARTSSNRILIFLNKGDGTFRSGDDAVTPSKPEYNTTGLDAGDVDGDGDIDLVSTHLNPKTLNVNTNLPGGILSVLINRGNGTFFNRPPKKRTRLTKNYAGTRTRDAKLVDIDGDGKLDFLSTKERPSYDDGEGYFRPRQGGIHYNWNQGNGYFDKTPCELLFRSDFCGIAEVADFNNDGNVDLLMKLSDSILIRLNNGLGNFKVDSDTIYLKNNLFRPALGDFDGDKDIDFAVSLPGTRIQFFWNKGDGTFTSGESVMKGVKAYHLIPFDFENDGDLDVLVPNVPKGQITVLENNKGKFASTKTFAAGKPIGRIALGDFDGDGIEDIAVERKQNSFTSTITILRRVLKDGKKSVTK